MKPLNEQLLALAGKAARNLTTLQMQIESPLLAGGFRYSSLAEKQIFHSASVGKMMTAVVVVRAIERGLLDWTTPVGRYLDGAVLADLFVYRGTDYADRVTVEQLLAHTSGVNDYFEGKSTMKPSMIDRVVAFPDRVYTPADLLDATRVYQTAVAAPGTGFWYSDTGYVLLGMLAEKVYGKPFYSILNEAVFDPLGMTDTGLLFDDPKCRQSDLAPVVVRKRDIRSYASLSADHAGGGLATTTSDLTRFLRAMFEHRLIGAAAMDRIAVFKNHFQAGMFYGTGLMELRFEKFFFLLRGLPRLWGHLGVLGVHAWWNPQTGETFVLNVGDMDQMVPSFQLLIQAVALLEQTRKQVR